MATQLPLSLDTPRTLPTTDPRLLVAIERVRAAIHAAGGNPKDGNVCAVKWDRASGHARAKFLVEGVLHDHYEKRRDVRDSLERIAKRIEDEKGV